MRRIGFFTSFAWKMMRRNAGRTMFVVLAVTLAASVAMLVMSLLQGMSENLKTAVVLNNIGNYQIQDRTFSEMSLPEKPQELNFKIESALKEKGITKYSPETILEGYLTTPEGDAALTVVGIDPKKHLDFLSLGNQIQQGTFFKQKNNREIVIGSELAFEFSFTPGDELVLNYQDHVGDLRSEIFTITGIYNFSSKSFQKKMVYVQQEDWQEIYFGKAQNKVLFNRLPMMTDNHTIQNLDLGKELVVKSWKDENPEMAVAVDFNNLMIRFCLIIVFLTAFLTVWGPIQILWEERENELKMLNVIGIGLKDIYTLTCVEFLILFIISVAVTITSSIVFYFASSGSVDLNFLNEGMKIERAGIVIDWLITPTLTLSDISIVFGLIFLVLSISYFIGVKAVLRKIERGVS